MLIDQTRLGLGRTLAGGSALRHSRQQGRCRSKFALLERFRQLVGNPLIGDHL